MDKVAQCHANDATLNAHPFLTPQTILLEHALNQLCVIAMGYHTTMRGL